MSEIAHSKLGASSYYRWKACPGSVKLSEGIESTESSYAREGTLAHDVASGALDNFFFQKGKPAVPPNMASDFMPSIIVYVDAVKRVASYANAKADSGHILIENRFNLEKIHKGMFGTADAVIYWPDEKKLTVIDYKHGAGIPVEAINNLQLLYYGLGAMVSNGFRCNTLEVKIIQPRCPHKDGPERTWSIGILEILDFMQQLGEDARATEVENAPLNPGGHCRFCPAAPSKCPKLKEKALVEARKQFGAELAYDPIELKDVLDKIPMLEAYVKSVREFAYQEALKGRGASGYKLVQKRATRKWNKPDADISRFLDNNFKLHDHALYTKKLLSPAQIEKLIPKDNRKELEKLIVKESSGYKLVTEASPGIGAKLDPKSQFKVIE